MQPLSVTTLWAAIYLLKTTFPYPPWTEHYALALPLSLTPKWCQRLFGLAWLHYWVVMIEGEVIGITGIYSWVSDPLACWVGWTCVAPSHRRQGIGTEMIQYAIAQAGSRRAVEVNVYTERTRLGANRLYQKLGFAFTRSQDDFLSYSLKLRERSSVEH